jgi:hypothetical protein
MNRANTHAELPRMNQDVGNANPGHVDAVMISTNKTNLRGVLVEVVQCFVTCTKGS